MKHIVVVGAGVTGLTAAYRLKTAASTLPFPVQIHLLETSSRVGGTLRTVARDGFLLETGPDCFIEKGPVVNLCEETGLIEDLLSTRTEHRRSFIVRRGALHPIPEGFYLIAPSRLRPFLSSPLLSWPGKWRVLMESLLPAKRRPSRPSKDKESRDESLASFVRRRLGQEALDWLAQPLLAGIYAADPETLSLQATFPQFLQMEEKYGSVLVGLKKAAEGADPAAPSGLISAVREASGARYSLFLTLRNGMQTLTDQLEKKLTPETLRKGATVRGIRRDRAAGPGRWQIRLGLGETVDADAICLALPAHGCADLLKEENPALAEQLRAIPYTDSATLNFGFLEGDIPHPLNGIGFVTPHLERRTTLACTFVHRKFTGRVPEGRALLRAFVGGALQGELVEFDDRELTQRVLKDLKDILGITQPPQFTHIQRWRGAMPQYIVGHVQRRLQIEETLLGLPGLALAGNWQRGVGIPDCIESGELAANRLLDYLKASPAS